MITTIEKAVQVQARRYLMGKEGLSTAVKTFVRSWELTQDQVNSIKEQAQNVANQEKIRQEKIRQEKDNQENSCKKEIIRSEQEEKTILRKTREKRQEKNRKEDLREILGQRGLLGQWRKKA